MSDEFLWSQKYRPKTVDECILPERLKNTFQAYVDKKEIPNMLLVGSPGCGKTSLSLAMCEQVGCDYLFLNASKENGIDTLRTTIENYATTMSLSGGRKVIILDEFFGTKQFQEAFKSSLELYSTNCTFLMTCNHGNKVIEPIHSRSTVIDFKFAKEEKKKLIVQFFKRVCNILTNENIEYDKEALAAFITKWYPDNRRILNELQRYSVNGRIDVGVLTQIGDFQLKDLIQFLKNKEYTKTREWIVNNADNTSDEFYGKVYDALFDHINKQFAPELGILCAKYQYQNSMVSDAYIQLLGFFTEVMMSASWK